MRPFAGPMRLNFWIVPVLNWIVIASPERSTEMSCWVSRRKFSGFSLPGAMLMVCSAVMCTPFGPAPNGPACAIAPCCSNGSPSKIDCCAKMPSLNRITPVSGMFSPLPPAISAVYSHSPSAAWTASVLPVDAAVAPIAANVAIASNALGKLRANALFTFQSP
jgi:hypothetical protein